MNLPFLSPFILLIWSTQWCCIMLHAFITKYDIYQAWFTLQFDQSSTISNYLCAFPLVYQKKILHWSCEYIQWLSTHNLLHFQDSLHLNMKTFHLCPKWPTIYSDFPARGNIYPTISLSMSSRMAVTFSSTRLSFILSVIGIM